MNLVCLDTHYFTWALLERATLGQEDMIPKAKALLKRLDDTKAIVVVPTPIITELLMEADVRERDKILAVMNERFHVVEFNTLAAKLAADVWNTKKRAGVIDAIKKSGESMRTKIKIDTLILGSALAENVGVLYTQDGNLAKLADGLMVVATMPEIYVDQDLFNP